MSERNKTPSRPSTSQKDSCIYNMSDRVNIL